MSPEKNSSQKRYIRITEESGCFSANYKYLNENTQGMIVVYNDDEKSGTLKIGTKPPER